VQYQQCNGTTQFPCGYFWKSGAGAGYDYTQTVQISCSGNVGINVTAYADATYGDFRKNNKGANKPIASYVNNPTYTFNGKTVNIPSCSSIGSSMVSCDQVYIGGSISYNNAEMQCTPGWTEAGLDNCKWRHKSGNYAEGEYYNTTSGTTGTVTYVNGTIAILRCMSDTNAYYKGTYACNSGGGLPQK
jgi:hypothetical protein